MCILISLKNMVVSLTLFMLSLCSISDTGYPSGIPMQLTTDKGSERAWQHSIQDAFR
jgi:hypothetical protein